MLISRFCCCHWL